MTPRTRVTLCIAVVCLCAMLAVAQQPTQTQPSTQDVKQSERKEKEKQDKQAAKEATQGQPVGERVAASSNVEQELIKLDKDWSESSRRGDTAALEQIMAAEHTGTNPSGKVSTRAEALAQAKANAGQQSQDSATSDDYKVQVYGDTAVLTHRNTVSGTKDGQPFTNQSRTVHVFVKRDGRWQAVFSQSSPIAAAQPPAQPQTTQPPAEKKP